MIREQLFSAIADVPVSTLQNWRSAPPEKNFGPKYYKLPGGRVRYKLADVLSWIEAGRVSRGGAAR
jgi:hypothetical protein